MIIEDFGEFPFEIGDVLLEREDGALAILLAVHWYHIHLWYLTGMTPSSHAPVYTHHTDNFDDYCKVGHIEQVAVDALLREAEMKPRLTNDERIAQGIERLHALIDDGLEEYLEQEGDASYCPEITEATNAVFQDIDWSKRREYPEWEKVNWGIEGEWDRICRLYFVEGLRGEALMEEARKR